MAAPDDERSHPGAAGRDRRPDDGSPEASARSEPTVMKNIERVADKVKGLLRSDG